MVALISLLAGIALGVLLGRALGNASLQSRLATSEAIAQETKTQLSAIQNELIAMRQRKEEVEIAKTAAETKLAQSEKNLAEQKEEVERTKAHMVDAFRSLAAEALNANNSSFLTLAQEKFRSLKQEATGELDLRKNAIAELVAPIQTTLAAYQKETTALKDKQLADMGGVGQQLKSVAETQLSLHSETAKLVSALRSPQVRGSWGEITLRRTVELAGMLSHCDFVEQPSVTTESGRLRPDMLVKLPNGRDVVVDSKVPFDAYWNAIEAKNDQDRQVALDHHLDLVRKHVQNLSSKNYWEQFPNAPEFVVLFVGNHNLLASAAERDHDLIDYALTKKVILATPPTLVALLRVIEFGWRQVKVAEDAQRIAELGGELAQRMATLVDHVGSIGVGIKKAADSYDNAVRSLETRLLPQTRKFAELTPGAIDEIKKLEPLDVNIRKLSVASGE